MNNYQNRAKSYLRLGEQYLEASKQLFSILINNENSNMGLGKNFTESQITAIDNTSKSDLYLFVPAIFNCLQGTELLLKGLLLLNEVEFEDTHDTQKLLNKLQGKYDVQSEIVMSFQKIYFSKYEILKNFRKDNHITNTHDLYVSLRYPEDNVGKQYVYYPLMCNGDAGIKVFKKIFDSITNIKHLIWNEYNSICIEDGEG